jgi:hypothetical protein
MVFVGNRFDTGPLEKGNEIVSRDFEKIVPVTGLSQPGD